MVLYLLRYGRVGHRQNFAVHFFMEKIISIPIPNGIIMYHTNKFCLCCFNKEKQYFLYSGNFCLPTQKYLQNLPIFRGFFYLLQNLIYPLFFFHNFRRQIVLPSNHSKNINHNFSNIFHFIITVFVILLYFNFAYILAIFSNHILFLTLSYLLFLVLIFIIALIWADQQQLKKILYSFQQSKIYQYNKNISPPIHFELKTIIILTIFSSFIEGFIPPLTNYLLINIFLSFVIFFLLFGFVYEVMLMIESKIKNKPTKQVHQPQDKQFCRVIDLCYQEVTNNLNFHDQ